MPVLKSPEVVPYSYNGTTCFQQEVYKPDELGGFETDVGINDVTDLNVICNKIELDNVCPANALENSLRITIHLCEAWGQKDEILRKLLEKHHVNVHTSSDAYSKKTSTISTNGIRNIELLISALRSTSVVTEHEGASIHRQIANPKLLQDVFDAAIAMVKEDNEKRKCTDWRKSYPTSSDWQAFDL